MTTSVDLQPQAGTAARLRGFLFSGAGWPYLLVPLIPVALVLEFAHASAVTVFFASALGVIPTAALMGRATEELATRAGPRIGGFLNVTFGNAPELIISLFALSAGLHITGALAVMMPFTTGTTAAAGVR
jgi:Ca2+:H+ antiporter